jgi:hypothetical protein
MNLGKARCWIHTRLGTRGIVVEIVTPPARVEDEALDFYLEAAPEFAP